MDAPLSLQISLEDPAFNVSFLATLSTDTSGAAVSPVDGTACATVCDGAVPANSRSCELRIDYLIEDGLGPQWRPESAEIFILLNTLRPSGRFLRGTFFKNYLGWRGQKISVKISSGAQSENLEPSLTIQEFFSKKYSWFFMQRMCTLFG